MGKLNERQEKFCQEIMHGKTQRQAYYIAYPSSLKWKPESVDVRASALINSDKVSIRLAELRSEAERQCEITRGDLLEQLKNIGFADIDYENVKPGEKIKAIEVMAKILGYDKEVQSDTATLELVSNVLSEVRRQADEINKQTSRVHSES